MVKLEYGGDYDMTILFYLLTAYIIGTIMFGYIIGRLIGKVDIRTVGSGNVGATNVGRVMGKGAFIATFIGDASKAVFIIFLGKSLTLPVSIQLLGLLIVIIGHMWPITLSFHGGKGIASYLGGIIILEPWITVVLIGIFSVSYLILKKYTKAGLLSLFLTSICFVFFTYSLSELSILFVTTLVVLYADRFDRKIENEKRG